MENQIKNSEPAVMTDKGPYDTTRAKSADGRYTANKAKGYNLEQQSDTAPGTDQKWMENHKKNFNNLENHLDKLVYTPLFAKIVENFFMPMHIAINKNNPNHVPFLMRTNKYYDQKLGIDYVFGSKNEKGMVNTPFITTDLKVIDTFGADNREYNQPNVPLNLYKQVKDPLTGNLNWADGSFLNKNHLNKYYTYLCPKSKLTKREMKGNIINKTGFVDPEISEVRMIHITKDKLDQFVADKIMSTDYFKTAIEELKKGGEEGAVVQVPVAGEDFQVSLFSTKNSKGEKSIRMSIPFDAFERKKIKADIARRVPLNGFRI